MDRRENNKKHDAKNDETSTDSDLNNRDHQNGDERQQINPQVSVTYTPFEMMQRRLLMLQMMDERPALPVEHLHWRDVPDVNTADQYRRRIRPHNEEWFSNSSHNRNMTDFVTIDPQFCVQPHGIHVRYEHPTARHYLPAENTGGATITIRRMESPNDLPMARHLNHFEINEDLFVYNSNIRNGRRQMFASDSPLLDVFANNSNRVPIANIWNQRDVFGVNSRPGQPQYREVRIIATSEHPTVSPENDNVCGRCRPCNLRDTISFNRYTCVHRSTQNNDGTNNSTNRVGHPTFALDPELNQLRRNISYEVEPIINHPIQREVIGPNSRPGQLRYREVRTIPQSASHLYPPHLPNLHARSRSTHHLRPTLERCICVHCAEITEELSTNDFNIRHGPHTICANHSIRAGHLLQRMRLPNLSSVMRSFGFLNFTRNIPPAENTMQDVMEAMRLANNEPVVIESRSNAPRCVCDRCACCSSIGQVDKYETLAPEEDNNQESYCAICLDGIERTCPAR